MKEGVETPGSPWPFATIPNPFPPAAGFEKLFARIVPPMKLERPPLELLELASTLFLEIEFGVVLVVQWRGIWDYFNVLNQDLELQQMALNVSHVETVLPIVNKELMFVPTLKKEKTLFVQVVLVVVCVQMCVQEVF